VSAFLQEILGWCVCISAGNITSSVPAVLQEVLKQYIFSSIGVDRVVCSNASDIKCSVPTVL
jgi:hypothetical protein